MGARGPALRTIRTMCLRLSQGSLRLYYGVRSLPVLQLLLGYVACSEDMHVALHVVGLDAWSLPINFLSS